MENTTTVENIDDTTYNNKLSDYLRIIGEEGFNEVLVTPFIGTKGEKEKHYIFFHPADGILLSFDTYREDYVNGGKFYYNWKPNPETRMKGHNYTSSGHNTKVNGELIWVGDHDCRNSLRENISNLRNNGQFVTPWIEPNFLHLIHYMDVKNKDYNYKQINLDRVSQLPEEIRRAIYC